MLVLLFTGQRYGRHLTKRGRDNFKNKVENDGGFNLSKRGQKGGLDKHKHIVLRILDPEDYPEGIAARAAKEKEDAENNALPLNANKGKGPDMGPGIPNNGNYFAIVDGEHRLAEFPEQYAASHLFDANYFDCTTLTHL